MSGAAALLRDWYVRTVSPQAPSPAMTKAMLVNTATDLDGGDSGKGPRSRRPRTRTRAGAAWTWAPRSTTPQREYVDQDTVLDAAGQSFLRSYSVADTSRPVRITLAWTDPPPATVTGNAFVNDLDLEVSAGGRTYHGNWLAGGVSVPGGQADFRNNLENVVLPASTAGRMSVKVVAKTLGGDGVPGNGKPLDQDFALVVSNAQEQASSPVLVQGATTVDDTLDPQNGDGALEPGEYFTLHQGVRNTGTDVATGVSVHARRQRVAEHLPGRLGLPRHHGGHRAGDSTTSTACSPPSAVCGVDATGTLDVTSAEGGTQPVPVTSRPAARARRPPHQDRDAADPGRQRRRRGLEPVRAGERPDQGPRRAHRQHRPQLRRRPQGRAHEPGQLHDGPADRARRRPNNGGDDLANTLFDDEAPTVIGSGGSAAPYTGSFRPQGDQLSRFDGKEQQGTWKLRVSDRYENDTGSLLGWSMIIRTAQCDPNANAPETQIQAAPPSLVGSRHASFQFGSPRPNAQFQCRLDGGDFTPCSSPQEFGNLPEGDHTFEVRAYDQYGNVDGSPAIYRWTVDVTAPGPHIAAAGGSTPLVQGTAGTSDGDDASVRVDLYSGGAPSGSPSQSMVVARDGSGSFSARFDPVPAGTYTVAARQSDAAGNTGSSAPVSFTVAGAASQPPDFAVMAMDESIADAAAGRLTTLSSCEGACSRSTSLTVSSRVASKLGVPHRGTAPVRARQRRQERGRGSREGRPEPQGAARALGHSRGTKATLATPPAPCRWRARSRSRPELGPARVASRGLRLAGICSSQCTIASRLIVSASGARRLGIRSGGRSVAIGSATVGAPAGSARTFTVRIARSVRRALSRARGADLTLEVKVSGPNTASRSATRRVTLG